MTLLVGSIFHMTRKIVSEMTYNVSMGTLNPTIPYPAPDNKIRGLAVQEILGLQFPGSYTGWAKLNGPLILFKLTKY